MRKTFRPVTTTLSILVSAALLGGCVSTSTFDAKVSELQDARGQLESLQDQHSDLVRKNASLQEEHEALRAEYATASRERETYRLNSDELKKRVEALETEANQLDEERSALKEELSSSRDSLSTQISKLIDRSSRLASENAELSRKASALEAELSARDKRIGALSAALTEQEEKVRNLSGRVEEQEKKLGALTGTYDNLVRELKGEIQEGQIEITRMKDQLTVQMLDRILFPSGSAEINVQGRAILVRVGQILKNIPTDREIRVEGHTDNVPIGRAIQDRFPSNWELSTARATTVVRFLQEKAGLDPDRLSAIGFGEHRPLVPNDSPENRLKNRRIGIVLVPLNRDQVATDSPSPAPSAGATSPASEPPSSPSPEPPSVESSTPETSSPGGEAR